jgi:cytosine/adenosine deaminase-related metal-dependent hydrolase
MIIRGVEIVGEEVGVRDIVVSGPTIARVEVRTTRTASSDGPVLDLEESIAFPGLTNSHDHLEFNLYPRLGHKRYPDYLEWGADIHRRDKELITSIQRVPNPARLRWGALRNLLCGATMVAHHGAVDDDLGRLPIRTASATSIHSVGTAWRWRLRLNAPFGRSPYVVHVGEGISSRARHEIDVLLRWNVFRKRLIGVHAIAMRPDRAARFSAIVWCPLSNEFLYGATADILELKRKTTILFGTDSTLTAEWNLWNHLRRARELRFLDDRELFAAVTSTAAAAWGRTHAGRLVAGFTADLVVARKKAPDPWDAFFAIEPEDILLVLKAGSPVLCDTSLAAVGIPPPCSLVRIGASTKLVAEDVPDLIACLRRHAVEPNLPITAEPRPNARGPHSSA